MSFKGAIVALLALAAIHAFAVRAEAQERRASIWPTKAWDVSTPEEQGMDSRAVARLIDDVGTYKQDSLLIVRNGKIVADAYYAPYVAGIRHDLRSVTKSFVSTVIGVLVQQGKLKNVDRPVLDFFPDRTIANLDERKKAITVQNLLDMASGIAWVERVHTPDETTSLMYASPDPTGFVLDQPMSDPPGEQFYYKGGDPYLLSALVNKLTGQNALEFARKELFAPLGITDVRWARVDKQGVVTGESGMRVTPHDMAKLGYLYLRDGVWDGKRIIPSAWIERARNGKVTTNFGKYANLWWSIPDRDAFMALGRHGQLIAVFPKLDVVAVMTGVVPDGEKRYPLSALIDQIVACGQVGQAVAARSRRRSGAERVPAQSRDGNGDACRPGVGPGGCGVQKDLALWRQCAAGEDAQAEPCRRDSHLRAYDLFRQAGRPRLLLSEPIGLDGRSRGKLPPMPSSPTRGVGWTAVPLCSNAASWATAQWSTGPFSSTATS